MLGDSGDPAAGRPTQHPAGTPGRNGLAEWQIVGLAHGPDQIIEGLTVSALGESQLRVEKGIANVGGFVFQLTAAHDMPAIASNPSSSVIRIDRLVLRLTWINDQVVISFEVVSNSFSTVGGQLSELSKKRGGGSVSAPARYEVAIARWAVAPGFSVIAPLSLWSIGPGRCGARWAKSEVKVPDNEIVGVPGLGASVDTLNSWGHAPVYPDGVDVFAAPVTGSYSISLDASFTSSAFVSSSLDFSWLRLEGWNLHKIQPFVGDGTHWWASIDTVVWLPANSTFRPTLFNAVDNAGELSCVVSLAVARVAE